MASEVSDKKQQQKGKICRPYVSVAFRVILLAGCATGTFLHVKEFLEYYWTWPEVVDITIETDREVLLPTVTVCYTNLISRKMFCGNNPSKCVNITKESETCRKFPHYCTGEGNITLVKDTTFPQDIINFVHKNGGLLPRTYGRGPTRITKKWPALIYKDLRNRNLRCHSVSGFNFNMKFSSKKERVKDSIVTQFYREDLHFEIEDLFSPEVDPGVYFHIHSPVMNGNPALRGIFLKPGKIYNVQVRFEEEHHLPSPYKSDCLDYISLKEANGGEGPRSEEECLEDCMKTAYCSTYGGLIFHDPNFHLSYCNGTYYDPRLEETHRFSFSTVGGKRRKRAVRQGFSFSSVGGKRRKRAMSQEPPHWRKYDSCALKCKTACVVYKYPYTVQETDVSTPRWMQDSRRPNYIDSSVTVEFEAPELLVMKHKPQYQDVEVFSYIGGFLGIWLGFSLFSIADLFDNAFAFMGIFFRLLRCCFCFQICRQNRDKGDQENDSEPRSQDASQSNGGFESVSLFQRFRNLLLHP